MQERDKKQCMWLSCNVCADLIKVISDSDKSRIRISTKEEQFHMQWWIIG